MDAATLYMIITLADGSRHAMALQYPFATICGGARCGFLPTIARCSRVGAPKSIVRSVVPVTGLRPATGLIRVLDQGRRGLC